MSSKKSLKVGIVGAGIAGLGAAISLRRAGHIVEVFERSQFKNEVGAAITITPNATRVLDRWGFDYGRAGAVEAHQIRMYMGDSLKLVHHDSFARNEEFYGYKCWFLHRVDLHEGLRGLAVDPSARGFPARITLDAEVIAIDCENGILTLASGRKVQKDLLVVADGAHCRFLREITGKEMPMQKTGRSSFRTLIPFDRVMEDETTRQLFEDEPAGFMAPFIPGNGPFGGVICVTYPCKGGQILNCAVMHPMRKDMEDREDWHSPATVDDVLECIKGSHPTLQTLFKKADVVKVYTLMDHDPLDKMTRGKAVLIGDAAHPMLPTHAQGGCTSLEDAAALEVLFSGVAEPHENEIAKRLQLFQDVRLARCAVAQIMSNNFARTPEKTEQDVRKYYAGPIPSADTMPFGEAYRDFFWSYDVFGESAKVLHGGEKPRIFGRG